MRDGFLVLLGSVVAERQAPAGEVGLGVIGMVLQELLELLDGDRVELPVVDAVRYVVLL